MTMSYRGSRQVAARIAAAEAATREYLSGIEANR
jgi:hypothetical protein